MNVPPARLVARRSALLPRFGGVWRDALALLLSLRDPRVGSKAKVIALLAALYALSPVDLLPDGVPVLGLADDFLIVPAVLAFAARGLPAPVLLHARGRVARLPKASRLIWSLVGVGLVLVLACRLAVAALRHFQ